MEPVYFTIDSLLIPTLCQTALRDGIMFEQSLESQELVVTTGRGRHSGGVWHEGSLSTVDFGNVTDWQIKERLEYLWLASGSRCSVPGVFAICDGLYCCELHFTSKLLPQLAKQGVDILQLETRSVGAEQFVDGALKNNAGATVRIATAAAFDSVKRQDGESVRLEVCMPLFGRQTAKEFLAELMDLFEKLGGQAIVRDGKVLA